MLKERVLTAAVLVALLGALLVWGDARAWMGALLLVSLLAGWEWARLSGLVSPWLQWGYGAAVALFSYYGMQVDVRGALPVWLTVLWLGLVPFILYHYSRTQGRWRLGMTPRLMLGLVVIFPFVWTLYYGLVGWGVKVVLWWMALVWLMDVGAYFAGRRFGRRKLAPGISPGKTWEGVLGGALAVMLGVWSGAQFLGVEWHAWQLALFGVIAVLSVEGDLFESVLKRWQGMKDSSGLLPGHGGVLDRIDSLLLAIPWMWWVGTMPGMGA